LLALVLVVVLPDLLRLDVDVARDVLQEELRDEEVRLPSLNEVLVGDADLVQEGLQALEAAVRLGVALDLAVDPLLVVLGERDLVLGALDEEDALVEEELELLLERLADEGDVPGLLHVAVLGREPRRELELVERDRLVLDLGHDLVAVRLLGLRRRVLLRDGERARGERDEEAQVPERSRRDARQGRPPTERDSTRGRAG